MDWNPLEHKCAICEAKYRFGHHMYEEGTRIEKYRMDICRSCYEQNAQGWLPNNESVFLSHLNNNGITVPARNHRGLYPR